MLNMYNTLWLNYAQLTQLFPRWVARNPPHSLKQLMIIAKLDWRTSANTVYLTFIEAASINGDHYVMCDVTAPVIACWLADWSVFTPCPTITVPVLTWTVLYKLSLSVKGHLLLCSDWGSLSDARMLQFTLVSLKPSEIPGCSPQFTFPSFCYLKILLLIKAARF